MDPRMMGQGYGGYEGCGGPGGMGEESSGFQRMREQRLYQSLAERGRFGDIDKAKHNEQYKSYLLSNFDAEEYYGNGY